MEKERFMLDNLKIPAEWIHEAKVGRAVVITNVYIHSFFFNHLRNVRAIQSCKVYT